MREMFFLEKEIHLTYAITCVKCETRGMMRKKFIRHHLLYHEHEIAVYARNVKLRDGISSDIMCSTMNTKCSVCEKRVMTRRKFIRHYVLYHELKVALYARNVKLREGISSDIMCSTMREM